MKQWELGFLIVFYIKNEKNLIIENVKLKKVLKNLHFRKK